MSRGTGHPANTQRARWLLPGVGLGVLLFAVGAATVFRGELAHWLFERQASQRAQFDRMAQLEPGLHVAFCGTGAPLPDPSRAESCAVVIAGEAIFVIDSGSGSTSNITLMGLPADKIQAVFLTHFHSDHIADLGNLALQRWVNGAHTTPLSVIGPTGVEQVVQGFNQAYALDQIYRPAHHGEHIVPPAGAGLAALPFQLPERTTSSSDETAITVYGDNGVSVTALRVDHDPADPAVAYRFEYAGRSVVFSGDLIVGRSAGFQAFARGADLLIIEGLQPAMLEIIERNVIARGDPNLGVIMRDVLDYHTTPEQAAELAQHAGVGALLINHVVPPVPNSILEAAFLRNAPSLFSGTVRVARDGMAVTLPLQSEEIRMQSWF